MNGVRVIVATAMLAAGLGAAAASAAPPAARSSGKAVSIESVGRMLTDLGYQFQPEKDKDGRVFGYLVTIKVGNAGVDLLVNLSPDQNMIWFSMPLTKLDEPSQLKPEMLAALLRDQFKAGGTITFVLAENNQLILESWDLAAGLTADRLKADMLTLIQHALDTFDLWMPGETDSIPA